MKFIYTAENCPRCHDLMKHYDDLGIFYTERSSTRLTKPTDDRDEIDIDAFVLLSQQNMILPVEIDTKNKQNKVLRINHLAGNPDEWFY